jgi:leucyl aminopeptidase
MDPWIGDATALSTPLWWVPEGAFEGWLGGLPKDRATQASAWAKAHDFIGQSGRVLVLPGSNGTLWGVALGLGSRAPETLKAADIAALVERLPQGQYALATPLIPAAATEMAVGWAIGQYRFDRYRSSKKPVCPAKLVLPVGADHAAVRRWVAADALARDLINTPACDLGPAELAAAVDAVGMRFGARVTQVVGDELLAQGFPLIHAVGRAASAAPRLVDLRYGQHGPRVTIVGKGVCFDTGGLDLKPSSAMGLMKKDMGGAACALALAQWLMEAQLPIRLRLLIPAVENSVAGNAYRPGDVLRSRQGLTVEITNTDAEGRLVLADALTLAAEEAPDVLIDLATLTGAARVALGQELPALYASNEVLTADLMTASRVTADAMWPMPLWAPYADDLSSKIADLTNASTQSFAGSIVAALFLRRFVPEAIDWVHIDLYAWNGRERPGRPVGGEAQTIRALAAWLSARYPRT